MKQNDLEKLYKQNYIKNLNILKDNFSIHTNFDTFLLLVLLKKIQAMSSNFNFINTSNLFFRQVYQQK